MIEVASFYMDNIDSEVVELQSQIVARHLPPSWKQYQVLTNLPHPQALDVWMAQTTADVTIFLDIDCIPLCYEALSFLAGKAMEGLLVGCAQRAAHIENGGHLYAGPFSMAIQPGQWKEIGSPSFMPTARGDVGEELSYLWPKPPFLIYPTACEYPKWSLDSKRVFGKGTTYGENLFYHSFEVREDPSLFIAKCKQVLG